MKTSKNRMKSPERNSTLEQVTTTVAQAREETDRMVREHPATSALVTFSVGCCLGLFVSMFVMMPVRRREPHWYDRVWPPTW